MTNQNNAAQAAQDLAHEIWAAAQTPPDDTIDAAVARIVAVLSRLRAPVADESPMAKMAEALREKARQEQQAYQDRRNQATEWGPMPHGTEADLPASAPVAGEAQPVIHQHGFASDNQKLRAINESLDEQLEEVMAERDDYHDWADELSEAIAAHLGVEIGEHSSSNLPWLRALDAIKNAAPQASEAVRMEDLKAIAREVAADSAAIRAEARNAALEEAAKLMDQTSRSSGAALIRAQASAPVAGEAQQPVAVVRDNPEDYGTVIDALVALPVGTQLFAAPQPSSVAGEAQLLAVAWRINAAEDRDYLVEIDAGHAGLVRLTFRRQKAKRAKHTHWFWSAKRADAV